MLVRKMDEKTVANEELCEARVKTNVPISGLQREMLYAIDVARAIWQEMGPGNLYVTSCRYRDKHGTGSHHYKGLAIDLRSKNLENRHKRVALVELKKRLGPEYQVILESMGTDNEHFHIEYDPQTL